MSIYKLKPAIKEYLWGGNNLVNYGKGNNSTIAECWELSFHKDGLSTIASGINQGRYLKDVISKNEIGTYASSFPFFPVLIKIIDSSKDLSIQVHPDDKYALEHEGRYGKCEFWHIVKATKGAGIYLGLKEDSNKEEIAKAIKDKTILDKLNFIEVKEGEDYFIKPGTIHAIGKGITLIEVQQNSNITYRLYDYDRIGSDGKKRELHLDKALDVINYHKYEKTNFISCIADTKYFTSYIHDVKNNDIIKTNEESFASITFIEGEGKVANIPYKKFDTFFISANEIVRIDGSGKYILTTVIKKDKVVGVDIGGTNIKLGIIDTKGNILSKYTYPTDKSLSQEMQIEKLGKFINNIILNKYDYTTFLGIGVGCPGSINSSTGKCDYSNNLGWKDLDVVSILNKITSLPIRITNDANAACLAEFKFGAAKGKENVVMLTLGTGVGGGLILNGKLYEGKDGKGAELGHSLLVKNGRRCTCGRKGCLEAYASAKALLNDTKKEMKKHRESLLWFKSFYRIESVRLETPFDCADIGDEIAIKVVDNYISYLGEGILNFINIFKPDIILLGGGLSSLKERLTSRLIEYLEKNNYGFGGVKVEVRCADLENDAGIIGAACLFMN